MSYPLYTTLNIHAATEGDLLKMLETIQKMLTDGFKSGQINGTGEIHGRHEGAVCHGWFVNPDDIQFEQYEEEVIPIPHHIPDSPDLPPVVIEDSYGPAVVVPDSEYDHLAETEQLKALIEQIQKQCPGSIIVLGFDNERSE